MISSGLRQGLRRLARRKVFEVDVGMASIPAAWFFNRFVFPDDNHKGAVSARRFRG
jgi:hypothetical protein